MIVRLALTISLIMCFAPSACQASLQQTGPLALDTGFPSQLSSLGVLLENETNRLPTGRDDLADRPSASGLESATELTRLREMEAATLTTLENVLPAVVALEGGSGVIVSADGLILTASHVVRKPGRKIKVQLSNGMLWPAITLGLNEKTDTGMLKLIGHKSWPRLDFADVADSVQPKLQTGQWAIGLGYPKSFKRGAPAAVRLGRVLQTSQYRIVTDCAIMGGDSGGPLVNLQGQLIGISSKITKEIDQNYHVPIKVYLDEWDSLLQSKFVKQGGQEPIAHSKQDTDASLDASGGSFTELTPAFDWLASDTKRAVVKIGDGSRWFTGTLVSPDGLLVAKHSDIKSLNSSNGLRVLLDGNRQPCKVIGVNPGHDACLLELDSSGPLKPRRFPSIKFPNMENEIQPGNAVVSLAPTGTNDSPRMGVISVSIQKFEISKRAKNPDFGVVVDQLRTVKINMPGHPNSVTTIMVARIYPKSVAAKAGLTAGDLILSVNGQSVINQHQLSTLFSSLEKGAEVPVAVVKDGQLQQKMLSVPLASHPKDFDRWGGGPFSRKRFGFGNVLAHDGFVAPEHCGGPLIDLQGRVVGINIARATRVSTFALPISVVRQMVAVFRPQATVDVLDSQSAENSPTTK